MAARTDRLRSSTGTWIAAAGLAMGICALLALVVIAFLLPVGAEAGLATASVLSAGELEIRSAGLLIFFVVSAVLILWTSRPSSVLALRERGSLRSPRE